MPASRTRSLAFVLGLASILSCVSDWRQRLSEEARARDGGVSIGDDGGSPTAPDLDAGVATRTVLQPGQAVRGPCLDDAQCDDGLACTLDRCDRSLGRCVSEADHAACDDAIYCNGVELCDLLLGCRPGEPTTCADGTPCTVDWCDEIAGECRHAPRDFDADGDPDINCGQEGGDCDDLDPAVSSLSQEVCGNFRDDDCDDLIDEPDCSRPAADECASALEIDASGSYPLDWQGAGLETQPSCFDEVSGQAEVFVALNVVGEPRAVDLQLTAPNSIAVIALSDACDSTGTELACQAGLLVQERVGRSRMRLPDLAPGRYVVALHSNAASVGNLEVSLDSPRSALTNLACEQAVPVETGIPQLTSLSGAPSVGDCETSSAEQFFSFALAEEGDVQIFSRGSDDLAQAEIALLDSGCVEALHCASGGRPLHARSLPAGEYVVAVRADGPTDLEWLAQVGPPSAIPTGDSCADAPPLEGAASVDWTGRSDSISAGCELGALDTAFAFELAAPSDVLAVGLFASGDRGAVALAQASCGAADTLSCTRGNSRPVRALARELAPGAYRAIVESATGLPATVSLLTRPARLPVVVTQVGGCETATLVTEAGGTFVGNTSSASSELSASCDFAGAVAAPEQLLHLRLDEPRRVVLDLTGSEYDALLNVRAGSPCPGPEVDDGCSLSTGALSGYLDLDLGAGDYILQVDGYAGARGRWVLEVFTAPVGP